MTAWLRLDCTAQEAWHEYVWSYEKCQNHGLFSKHFILIFHKYHMFLSVMFTDSRSGIYDILLRILQHLWQRQHRLLRLANKTLQWDLTSCCISTRTSSERSIHIAKVQQNYWKHIALLQDRTRTSRHIVFKQTHCTQKIPARIRWSSSHCILFSKRTKNCSGGPGLRNTNFTLNSRKSLKPGFNSLHTSVPISTAQPSPSLTHESLSDISCPQSILLSLPTAHSPQDEIRIQKIRTGQHPLIDLEAKKF